MNFDAFRGDGKTRERPDFFLFQGDKKEEEKEEE
jgi:hypothetical protein